MRLRFFYPKAYYSFQYWILCKALLFFLQILYLNKYILLNFLNFYLFYNLFYNLCFYLCFDLLFNLFLDNIWFIIYFEYFILDLLDLFL